MPSTRNNVVAFDLYDTLLSTASVSTKLAEHLPQEKAQQLALLWRRYQLEYTWRLNSLERFDEYSAITRNSLDHAVVDAQVTLSGDAREGVLKTYDYLSAFPDVPAALEWIGQSDLLRSVIFSNGQHSMVSNSVLGSEDLGAYASVFEDIITVDPVRRFKPTADVYHYLVEKAGKTRDQAKEVWLVSGNAWDITGAMNAGLSTAWVDRSSTGWRDRMIPGLPTVQATNLLDLMAKIQNHVKSSG